MNLKDKVALVTGGSRGIGAGICAHLASLGMRVAFTYQQDSQSAAEVCQKSEAVGGQIQSFQADVRNRTALKDVFKRIEQSWGKLDLLVNNAGINKPTDFDQITDEDWDEVMSVNLKGPYVVSQEALQFMNDGASIVMIGSVSGQYGGPRTAHYAASKAGLMSLSQVIARFGASRKIRCNTIAAGLIASDMAEAGLQSPAVKKAAASIPLGELGRIEDVAGAVAFLASEQSRYITAQTINVNGGLYF